MLLVAGCASLYTKRPAEPATRYETRRYQAFQLLVARSASELTTIQQRRFFTAYQALSGKLIAHEITERQRLTESLRRAGFDLPEHAWADTNPFDHEYLYVTAPPATLNDIERGLDLKPVDSKPKK